MKDSLLSILKKLGDMAIRSKISLFKVDSLFPFDIFPDSLYLDREKLTVVNRIFFKSAKIISIPYCDIQNVELDVGPFMGSVKIKSRFFDNEPLQCKNLRKKDAIKLKQILAGFVIASQSDDNLDSLTDEQLLERVMEYGTSEQS